MSASFATVMLAGLIAAGAPIGGIPGAPSVAMQDAGKPAAGTPAGGGATPAAPSASTVGGQGDAKTAPPSTTPPARDAAAGGAENAPAEAEITPKLEDAVRKGFEYLRRVQKPDGSFGEGRYGEHIGVSSLCAISFMADGNVPGRGDFGDCVQKTLDFVLSHASETGLLVSDETHGPMYGHGFATLFLGEVYGMNNDDDRVRDALVRAVQLIVASQNDEGGWRYNPVPADADVSVTICEIMGLRSARNAGIKVPKSTIDDAVRYVRECQNPDGGFRYMRDAGGSAWPRTAAGIASLYYAGIYEDESISKGLEYLKRSAFPRAGNGGPAMSMSMQPHYFYGHYYAVQAMYLAGGEHWRTWWPAIREELLARQGADGSWSDGQNGNAYGTAMALIVLQMPKRYLPIFQR
ncbi:MAG: prenyltransferase/squalene oxidase repeat-containing protein [Phycisphaerales bacterium]